MKTSLPPIVRAASFAALAIAMTASAQAQRAAIDPQTGQLRTPTADEMKPANTKGSRPVGMITGRVNPPPTVHADGTVEQELDTSTMVYSVARRNADGTVSQYCVTGTEAAERLVHSKAPTQFAAKIGKEQKHAVK